MSPGRRAALNRLARRVRAVRRDPKTVSRALRWVGTLRPVDGVWRELLAGHLEMLPPGRRRVLVVSAADPPVLTDEDEVHVIAGDPRQLHEQAKRLGPVDVVLDLAGGGTQEHLARWRQLFFHLRTGGSYVIAARPVDEALTGWAADVGAREHRELAEAVESIVATPTAVVLRKRLTHRLKLRDHEVADVLPTREPALTVTELSVRPAGRFTSPATVIHHDGGRPVEWPEADIAYPALHLRRYEGEIAFHGGTLMHTGLSVLPDSFRWHATEFPSNPNAINASAAFARIPPHTLPKRSALGSFYQLDPQYGGYGHTMTEVVGRLWGWDEAKAADPQLKALFYVRHLGSYRTTPRYRVLRGYGIPDDDIVAVNKPVYVRSLASGTVMWHNAVPFYVHPDLSAVWTRLGDGLVTDETPTYDKIFVSRTEKYARRTCHNGPEVESIFAAAGFHIVYPELLDLGEQVAIFRHARVVAGFGGSALFNIMFAQRLETTIVLTHSGYFHRNEHLFTALLGGTVHYFWSTPDITAEQARGSYDAVESSWSFDFDVLGDELRQVVTEA